ncbi:MAG TPA: response regulator [Thermoanaerobaculia bacterium]
MAKTLRILLVEDSERDAALLLLYLKRGGYEPTLCRVQTAAEMRSALSSEAWDVIISDFNLPGFSGFDTLKVLKESGLDIPTIIVSGEINQKIIDGVKAAGAAEYLAKYEMRQIVPSIERVVAARPKRP